MNYKLTKKTSIFFIVILLIFLFPIKKVYGVTGREIAMQSIDAPIIDIELEEYVKLKKNPNPGFTTESFCFINNTDYYVISHIKTMPSHTEDEWGYMYLVNVKTGEVYQSSKTWVQWHCDSMAYDEQNGYVLTRSKNYVFVYKVDLEHKTFTKVNQIRGMGSVSMGHDDITDLFAAYDNNRYLKIYTREQFYAGKSWDTTKKFLVEGTNDSVMIRQPGEALGNYYYSVFSVHTTDFKFAGERHIKGNSIAVINMETGKIERQLYCGDSSAELQEVDFDSQGNLYVNRWDGTLYKTNYNAYAEGVVSAQPANRKELLENFITNILNIMSDFIQTVMEALDSTKDLTNISLTSSSSEIMEDELLQNDIQFENSENKEENQADPQDDNLANENDEEGQGDDSTDENAENLDTDEKDKDENINKTSELRNPNIKSVITNKNGNEETVFNDNTPIPIISMSFENFMLNKSKIFDLDFLNQNSQNSDVFWQYIRNFVVLVTRITLFMAASVLISAIILRAILIIVYNLKQDIEKTVKSKKVLNNVIKAAMLIIGMFVIIELIIYFYNFIVSIIIADKAKKYIIRANVDGLYSFNTSFMGLLKYMSLSTNIFEALKWSVLRFLCTLGNALLFYFMVRRTFTIIRLIIMAPFTAVASMFEEKDRKGILADLNYKIYIKKFIRTVFYPFIFIIILSLFM